jgi:hypothetical protein
MKPDQALQLQLVDKEKNPIHLSKVFLDIDLYTHGNYRYGFRLGSTNDQGRFHLNYGLVEAKRAEAAKIFLMDYNTLLADCDDRVKISVPTPEILKKAYDGIGQWFGGRVPDYAEGWSTANNAKIKAVDVFVELTQGESLVPIYCEVMNEGGS